MKTLAAALLLLAGGALPALAQRTAQLEDSTFVPRVEKPAFTDRHPVVLVDEAHHEYFTAGGRYRALARLLESDGFRVVPGAQRLSPPLLANCRILVIADALGSAEVNDPKAATSAFTQAEVEDVLAWVRGGGSLLLISDHAPFALAVDSLALGLGVDLGKGYTMDDRREDPETANPGCILYTRDKGMILDHPVTRGRDKSERINRVVTFTGQSLAGPPGSTGFLRLNVSAADMPITPEGRARRPAPDAGRAQVSKDLLERGAVPAGGRSQGLAFTFGRGRVVVMGEGAMFGAQLVIGPPAARMHKSALPLGLNRTDLDNQQLALNIARWLAGLLN